MTRAETRASELASDIRWRASLTKRHLDRVVKPGIGWDVVGTLKEIADLLVEAERIAAELTKGATP